ncbi:hypothetical protein [Streptomyces sp. WAC06614]|uniref:hypothetical protein n=1 Tax=Streptomyces sp. WAC06614 TaxID=2487416 RepID=UPI000F773C79|nr:hypothetical protein [Streptomyces sp. WAC06614]RSS78522.1 hypothetical protein EF918_20715 [Streptomyces sp. WAC06614]
MEQQLTAQLSFDCLLEPEELLEIAYEVGRDYARWRTRLAEPDGEGSWTRLFRAGRLGVWAIGWHRMPPGTGYLDHEQVRGAVYVARGAITHERARLGSPPHVVEVCAGRGFCFDETFYHRIHAVRDAGPTVTVHVFATAFPPTSVPEDVGPALRLGLP